MKEQLSVGQALTRAFAHLDAGNHAEARRFARMLESQRPEPSGLAYLLGLLALADGQGRKAAQHLARALAQTPTAVPPLLAYARAQSRQKRLPDAVAAYRRLLAVAPDLAVGWCEWADLCLQAEGFRAALRPLQAAAHVSPANAPLRNNLGIASRAAGDLESADRQFRIAIALDPTAAKPYANLAGLLRHRRLPAIDSARRAVALDPDNAGHRIDYGQALADHGDVAAALAAFQFAHDHLPNQPEPLWLMAQSLRQLGRIAEAGAAYRDLLALDPADNFGAQLALAQLGAGAVPARVSDAHVSGLYDQYAGSFDRDLIDHLDYRGPAILLDGLQRAGIAGPLDILDAGCGTGLAGIAVKPLARRLDGIDLSAKMAALARERGIYDRVAVGDLVAGLSAHRAAYDLVIAADVLIYQGDLNPVAAAAAIALRAGGHFAFTVERSDQDPFCLQSTGRFAHSAAHLQQIAAHHGFSVLLLEPTATRREQGSPVPSLLCVLKKS